MDFFFKPKAPASTSSCNGRTREGFKVSFLLSKVTALIFVRLDQQLIAFVAASSIVWHGLVSCVWISSEFLVFGASVEIVVMKQGFVYQLKLLGTLGCIFTHRLLQPCPLGVRNASDLR
jgi:hypothetical protein